MNRPRKPMPIRADQYKFNNTTGLYEIYGDGIVYYMDFSLLMHFKNTYGPNTHKTIENWYNDQSKEIREKIVRTGNVPKAEDDFYPDVMSED